jgi:hypothetical protein
LYQFARRPPADAYSVTRRRRRAGCRTARASCRGCCAACR